MSTLDFDKLRKNKNSTSELDFEAYRNRQVKEIKEDESKKYTSDLLNDTLKSVMNPTIKPETSPKPVTTTKVETPTTSKGIDFKATQAADMAAKADPFAGKTLAPINTATNDIQQTLQGKVPAASLLQQTGKGPANASQIPGISQYEITKKGIAESGAPKLVKSYANIMNAVTQGNPLGQAVSRSFAGNSGVTRRDSTGNKTVDKITDLVNDLVTPFITPTGAPLGQGIIGSSYETAGQALNSRAGQTLLKGAGKVIPGSDKVVRVAATEGLAGGIQGAAFGLQQGQDSGNEIISNSLYGVAGGAVLAGAGTALGEVLEKVFKRVPKNVETSVKNTPYEGLTREQRIYKQYLDDVPLSQEDFDFMVSPEFNESNLVTKVETPVATDIPATAETPFAEIPAQPVNVAAEAPIPARATVETPKVVNFKTSKGSEYTIGENGITTRNKTLHEGHSKTDVGLKEPSEKTLYVNKDEAARIGSHFSLNKEAKPKVLVRDDGIYLLSWNTKENRWGLNGEKIPYTDTPKVGESPIEFWGIKNDPQLGNTAHKVHAGNEITEINGMKKEVKEVKPKSKTALKPVTQEVAATTELTPVKTKTVVAVPTTLKPKTTITVKRKVGERGFYQNLKNSGKADEAVARMDPKYEPISNETSLSGANKRVRELSKATSDVLSRPLKTAEDGATALRLIQEYTKAGDHETAAIISGKAAEDFTQAGQLIQSASMWDRLSPEGMLLRVQREISKVNDVLGPAEEKLSLSAADAAKISNTGEKLQDTQGIRDLSQDILDMVSNKKPGETLTADEKKLLAEFEAKVKKVNSTVKPFLKTAKSEADKIAKIKPENRTRDQVVQYLDTKAAEAQARIAKRRNIGIVAQANNPVIDYSIIAAAKIARGVRTFSDLTEDMVKTVGSEYKQYADEVFTKATQRFRKENGLPTTTELERVIRNASKEFDEESKNALRRMASEIGYYTDENLKRELTQDLQQVIKTYGRSTLGEKIAGIQTASQLLSVPTFLRNTLGNAGQFGLEKINKISAVPIDWTLSKFTGNRTIQFMPKNQEQVWKNFVAGTGSGWREVNAMGTLDSYNVKPSVFSDKNPLKYLTKLTGASLQGMDYAAYKAAYGDVMATYAEQLGRAQGMTRKQIKANMPELLTRLDDNVRALADQAGLYATYQDETMLSRAAQGTKKALNSVTDKISKSAVEKGLIPRSLSLEGFGLGDVVLKYAKTPANLVMRGIDYSPLGFIRAIGEFAPLLKNGGKNFNQFNATRALSRAITGTVGLTAVGYAMADAGLLTGASSSDADKRSIEEQSGEGAYKANLTGIYRWIMSGFDKNEAKYKKGDKLIDYAWLQPAAISLGMGVNFREAQNAKKPGEKVSNVEMAKRSIIGGLRTVLENPMVTGLSDVVGGVSDLITRQDTKKLTGIVKGIPSSFVPALAGQARNVVDNKQRVTYDTNVLKEMLNLVKNRLPGLSKSLPISYDSLGNERQRIQGGKENTIGQYLNSFLNPTKVTTFNVSPEAKTVLDILNESNDSAVLPRVIQKTVAFTNEDGRKESYRLSKEEYSALQKKTGKRVLEELQYEQDYLSDSTIDIEDRVKVLKNILGDVGRETRDEFKQEKGLVND